MSAAILALALGTASSQVSALEMQVEEPASITAPPIDPDQEGGVWKNQGSSPSLSRAEKAALEERRRKVEEMSSRIREKRDALESSGLDGQAARVRILEDMLLDGAGAGNGDGQKLDHLEKVIEKKAQVQEKILEKKLDKIQKSLEKQLDRNLEKMEKVMPDEKGKTNQGKSGK